MVGFVLLAAIFGGLAGGGCAETENRPPQLQPIDDPVFRINQPNTLNVFASDPDGDARAFDFSISPLPPASAGTPTLNKVTDGQAIFQWTPRISALGGEASATYNVTFTVRDGRGGEHAETVAITVVDDGVGGTSTLRFAEPAGSGMAVGTDCVTDLPVEVRAEAIANEAVTVELVAPLLEGASLTPGSGIPGKSRRFNWCPTEAQLNTSLSHTVTFAARETNSDEPVIKRYLFRFRRQAGAGCAGQPPTIEHTAPGQFEGPLNYVIEARITDDVGFKAPPVLAYVVNPAQDPRGTADVDISGWQVVNFERAGGDRWQATVPNLGLASGASAQIYYQIIATDNDDPDASACDHTAESAVFRLIARGGGTGTQPTYGACSPCVSDAQCGDADDRCVSLRGEQFCGTGCEGGADCPGGYQCLLFDSVDGVSTAQCVPADLNCGQICVDDVNDARSRNDAPNSATPLAPGTYENLSICTEDVDIYAVRVAAGQSVRASIRFSDSRGDLDLAMALPGDPTGEFNYQSLNSAVDEEVVYEPCTAAAGDAIVVVLPFDNAENTYGLTVEVGAGDCNQQCEGDFYDQGNGNDVFDDFAPVDLPFYEDDLFVCRADRDFFGFDASAGQVVEATLLFEHRLGDLDLRLYNSNGVVAESLSYRDIELIEYRVPADDIFIVEVFGATRSVSTDYALEIRALAAADCQSTRQCPEGTYCTNLGCVDAYCSAFNQCGPQHLCVAPRAGLDPGAAGGECASICGSDADCRGNLGYACKRFEDFTLACAQAGAGAPGDRCGSHADCGGDRICYPVPGGYCASGGCDRTLPCPAGTVCGTVSGLPACLKACTGNGDCRAQDGHRCLDVGNGQLGCRP